MGKRKKIGPLLYASARFLFLCFSILLSDGADGAGGHAGSALDAGVGVNVSLAVLDGDSGNGANSDAGLAAYANGLINCSFSHGVNFLLARCDSTTGDVSPTHDCILTLTSRAFKCFGLCRRAELKLQIV